MSKENDPNVLDTLSLAYYLNGDRRRAIETEERAIALASDQHGRAAKVAQLERFERAGTKTKRVGARVENRRTVRLSDVIPSGSGFLVMG